MTHTIRQLIVTSVITLVLCITSSAPAQQQIRIQSNKLNIELDHIGNQVRLVDFSGPENWNRLTRHTIDNNSLWELRCVATDNRDMLGQAKQDIALVLTDADATDCRVLQEDATTTIEWDVPCNDSQITVRATITLQPGRAMSHWGLTVKMPQGVILDQVDYPVVSNIEQKDVKLAWPTAWGWECDFEILKRRIPGRYPGSFMVMQFFGFYTHDHGMYYAAHDTDGYFKIFEAYSNDDVSATSRCAHMLSRNDASKPYTWKMPYDMIMGVYEGDYYEAAQLYRTFVEEQSPWWNKAQKAFDNAPDIIKRADMVPQPDHYDDSMEVLVTRQLEFKQYMDNADMLLWWWHWNDGIFKHGKPPGTERIRPWHFYPFMYPPMEGWKDGLKILHEADMITLPYCDPLRVVITEPTFGPEGWYRVSVKHEDGKTYFRRRTIHGRDCVPGKGCQYIRPCAGSSQFPGMIYEHMIRPMIEEYGSGGMYLDELGAAWPDVCYDPTHGHPPGGGNWWSKGIVRFIRYLRKTSPQTVWMTENNPDCYMGDFDLFLMVSVHVKHIRAGIRRTIPLQPIVWSGKYYPVGQKLMLTPESDQYPHIFRASAAESLLWGAKFGGFHVGFIMRPENAGSLAYLRQLVRCRTTCHKYVQNGRCLGMLDVTGDNPIIITEGYGGDRAKTAGNLPMRSVMAAGWQARDNTIGLVMANIADQAHTVRVSIPCERAGVSPDTAWQIAAVEYLDAPDITYTLKDTRTIEITLPPLTPVVLACPPPNDNT